MPIRRFVHFLRFPFLLILLTILPACSSTYQGDEFSFSAPIGFKTKQYAAAETGQTDGPKLLLFTQKGSLYFQVLRQKIPLESDLGTVFAQHLEQPKEKATHYQFISQGIIEIKNQSAIEYIYREFRGEPYVQTREIWLKKNGWAYSLICTDPVDSTTGLVIPVSEQCIRLVEGFQFK